MTFKIELTQGFSSRLRHCPAAVIAATEPSMSKRFYEALMTQDAKPDFNHATCPHKAKKLIAGHKR